MILRSKTNLSDDQISQLSDAEGWRLIYTPESVTFCSLIHTIHPCFPV